MLTNSKCTSWRMARRNLILRGRLRTLDRIQKLDPFQSLTSIAQDFVTGELQFYDRAADNTAVAVWHLQTV